MEASVLVAVINWNLKEVTAACVESVFAAGYPCRVLIVDNGSRDDSAGFLAARFPAAEILAFPDNLGFAAACNAAMQVGLDGEAEFVCLLNNDALVHADFFSELVRVAGQHPEAGILGPTVFRADDPDTVLYAGARRRRWVLAAVPLRHIGRSCETQSQARDTDYVFGCGMFIRRQVIEQVGMLDPRFFLYLEDMDYCLRVKAAGYRVIHVPQAKMWHIGSASTSGNPALRNYHLCRSTWLFLQKHASQLSVPVAAAFWASVFLRSLATEVLRGNQQSAQALCSGLLDGWRALREG